MGIIPGTEEGRPATIGEGGRRNWLYPQLLRGGTWMRRRNVVYSALMLVYLLVPWLQVGGHQAVLLDLPRRKFAFFGFVLWPQDSWMLWMLLITGMLGVFFFTALLGRVWCGWACPQTVFMEGVFRRIEAFVEGDANARRKLDDGPWDGRKVLKKSIKHLIFILISVHIANTFLCYFAGTDLVVKMTLASPIGAPGWFLFMSLVAGAFYFDFAWFREQVCTIVCPYGRWQSVLLDEHSLIVGYDAARGDPRGTMRTRRGSDANAHGDCIDCGRCVDVCPTGIDIRAGLQMECINCTACIDVCDEVMLKTKRPAGLIRYTSLRELGGLVRKPFRPRTVAYAVVLLLAMGIMSTLAAQRTVVEVQVLRAYGDTISAGAQIVSNRFDIRVINKSEEDVALKLEPQEGFTLIAAVNPIGMKAGSTGTTPLFVQRETRLLKQGRKVNLVFTVDGHEVFRKQVELLGGEL